MQAITVPDHVHVRTKREHPWLKKAGKCAKVAAKSVTKVFSPHKASLHRLSEIPLTLGGIGCIAAGVFIASTIAGFIVLGAALILLEYLIADSE